jgi:hypothetical protein
MPMPAIDANRTSRKDLKCLGFVFESFGANSPRMWYEAWYERAVGDGSFKNGLFSGSGGALPPFPTPTKPTILHPILRIGQVVNPGRAQLYAHTEGC